MLFLACLPRLYLRQRRTRLQIPSFVDIVCHGRLHGSGADLVARMQRGEGCKEHITCDLYKGKEALHRMQALHAAFHKSSRPLQIKRQMYGYEKRLCHVDISIAGC